MLTLLLALAWHTVQAPAEGPAEAIGGHSYGCLKGGVALPKAGPGYESIRRHRRRFYGHPHLRDWIISYGARLAEAKQPPILVGDLSQPLGGRMRRGHRSHQSGLDVDLWFTAPKRRGDDKRFPSMVTPSEKISKHFKPLHAQRIQWAAESPGVARVFVNWVIKRHLCAKHPEAPWLAKVRPWYGHDKHFHVRLTCPADSPDCVDQEPATVSGCGEEAWFSRAEVLKRRKNPPPPNPKVKKKRNRRPARCDALLKAAQKHAKKKKHAKRKKRAEQRRALEN